MELSRSTAPADQRYANPVEYVRHITTNWFRRAENLLAKMGSLSTTNLVDSSARCNSIYSVYHVLYLRRYLQPPSYVRTPSHIMNGKSIRSLSLSSHRSTSFAKVQATRTVTSANPASFINPSIQGIWIPCRSTVSHFDCGWNFLACGPKSS